MKDKRIFTLILTIFIDLIGFGIVIPILPLLTKTVATRSGFFLGPDMAIGAIVFCFAIMQFLFAPLWGGLSDRVGRRPIILGSILVTATGYFLLGFGQSLWILFVARIISGIGSANISAAQAYIADITPPKERAKKMGLIGAAFGFGLVIGPPLGGWIFEYGKHAIEVGESMLENGRTIYPDGGLRLVGFFTAGLCLVNFVMAYFTLSESLVEKNANRKNFFQSFHGLVTVWKVPVLGELFVINFIYIAAFMMMQIISSLLWKEQYGISESAIGNIFGFMGICSAVIQGGFIGFFQKKLGVVKMLLIGCPVVAIALLMTPWPSAAWFYPVQLTAIFLICLGNGLIMPAINALVSINSSPADQGKTLGALQSLGSLARGIGPLLSTFLYGIFIPLPYLVAGGIMIIAFLVALRLIKQVKNENKPVAPELFEYEQVDT
jgi:MFS transporter, DHA1 family, tetracycline resistance protein